MVVVDGGWWMVDGGWWWWMVDGGWWWWMVVVDGGVLKYSIGSDGTAILGGISSLEGLVDWPHARPGPRIQKHFPGHCRNAAARRLKETF